MQRNIFADDAETSQAFQAFRDLARTFTQREVEPHHEQWEEDGQVSREVWLAAGKAGLLGMAVPEEFGGGGVADFRYNAILDEELVRAGASGIGFPLQNDVVAPYLPRLCNDEQRRRWLPGFCSGELITAIAMTEPGTGSRGFSLLVVEREVGQGLIYLMRNLPQERLSIAVSSTEGVARALEMTTEYTRGRHAFGKPISAFQNTRFELAEIATEAQVARVFTDRCLAEHVAGELSATDAAMAKWWTSDLLKRTVDRCVQLHGGYGYMLEYPIARAFVDARVQSIFGGTNEIMKEIVGRSLFS